MQRSSVDLPDPDGPMMQTASPLVTVSEMPRSTSVAPNDLCTSTRRTIGASRRRSSRRRSPERGPTTRGAWPGRGEKALEVGVRDDHRRRVDERMRVHRFGVPQRAVDDEFDRARASLTSASRLTEPGVIPRYFCNRSGDAKPSRPAPSTAPSALRSTARSCGTRDQEMPRPLLVAQEEVLGLGARQLRHEALRLLDRHHRRVLVPRGAMPCSRRKASRGSSALRVAGFEPARPARDRVAVDEERTAARSCRSGSAGRCGLRHW